MGPRLSPTDDIHQPNTLELLSITHSSRFSTLRAAHTRTFCALRAAVRKLCRLGLALFWTDEMLVSALLLLLLLPLLLGLGLLVLLLVDLMMS